MRILRAKYRSVTSLSGGEQKRLVLELLLGGPAEVLLLDEPDNYLDVPGKQWLEQRLAATGKAVLLVSHDREFVSSLATRILEIKEDRIIDFQGNYEDYLKSQGLD